ncbi:MAG: signal peptide peptidase SppA [Acidobacteria bacterium]|nr:signal peptide peptidase SppA [Acidobacteriota bacterium]
MPLRRSVAVVLALVGLAAVVSIAGILFLFLIVSRGPSVPAQATLVLRPGGELVERLPDDVVGQVFGRDAVTLRGFVDSLRMAKRDPRITGVLLLPTALELPFWAKVQELRDAILDFRTSGKPVVAFLEYGGDREYYLASAADRVYLLPTSPLDLTGVASYEIFLRGALDKLGVAPDFEKIGDYKTAANQLTEKGFTPAHREMSEWLNRDLYAQLVRGIAEARSKTDAEVRALIDEGPFAPEAALGAGLVDGLAYLDQLDDEVPELRPASGEPRRIEGSDYARVSPRTAGLRPRSRIAVLHASGIIASGKSAYDTINGPIVGSETMVEQIRRIRDDDSIRAIVVRIDSPGGSSVASDVIWRELIITRDQRPSRPLVASMSDLAASGGYYIAMPGQAIVAQPASLTGSIGIYAGKMALDGAMDKLGVSTETVTSGSNADMASPFSPFTPDQRVKLQDYMQGFYRSFVEKAAASRRMTPEQIDAVAQGRVWTGQQALERGLVDALGGLEAAVALAKERADIPADEDVELVAYPPRRSVYEALREQFGSSRLGVWNLLAGGAERRAMAALTAPVRLFRRGEPLALMPFAFVR